MGFSSGDDNFIIDKCNPLGLRFCSLIKNNDIHIDEFNDFFSIFISLPDRVGNIAETAFPKFLRFLLKI